MKSVFIIHTTEMVLCLLLLLKCSRVYSKNIFDHQVTGKIDICCHLVRAIVNYVCVN